MFFFTVPKLIFLSLSLTNTMGNISSSIQPTPLPHFTIPTPPSSQKSHIPNSPFSPFYIRQSQQVPYRPDISYDTPWHPDY